MFPHPGEAIGGILGRGISASFPHSPRASAGMVTASAGSGSENFTVETMQKMAGIFGYQVVIGLRRMPHGTGKGFSAMEIKRRIAKRKGANNG